MSSDAKVPPFYDEREHVLFESFASERQCRNLWFRQMTPIGPMTTDKFGEAARFPTGRDACQSPAMAHALSFYEPRPAIEFESEAPHGA